MRATQRNFSKWHETFFEKILALVCFFRDSQCVERERRYETPSANQVRGLSTGRKFLNFARAINRKIEKAGKLQLPSLSFDMRK